VNPEQEMKREKMQIQIQKSVVRLENPLLIRNAGSGIEEVIVIQ